MTEQTGETARVAGIWVTATRHEPAAPLDRVRALADYGFEGDAHARPGSDRQLLLMDQESLDRLGLAPGALKENLTTAGFPLYDQPSGTRLRIGSAVIELTKPCPPCRKMEKIRLGLREELVGRRGYLARVIESGDVQLGDAIEPI